MTFGVDAGAAVVTYDGYDRSAVASVNPSVRWDGPRAHVTGDLALSRFESGNTSVQATVAGSVLSPELWKVRGEVAGAFSTTRYMHSVAATNVFGVGRLHTAGSEGGAWIGAGGGFVSQGSELPGTVTQLDAGAWVRDEGALYTIAVRPTRVAQTFNGSDLRYADVVGVARFEGARGDLALSVGYRGRPSDNLPGVQAWAEGTLTVWVTRRAAVVTGGGVFPFDALQSLPGGRYASAGIRLVTRRPESVDPALRATMPEPYELRRLRATARARAAAALFHVVDNGDGLRTVRLRAPGARRVELMADFTDWTVVSLSAVPGTGEWVVALAIGPGVHHVNVRVDDGAWAAPPGLSSVRDDFGGDVGLLVVH